MTAALAHRPEHQIRQAGGAVGTYHEHASDQDRDAGGLLGQRVGEDAQRLARQRIAAWVQPLAHWMNSSSGRISPVTATRRG
jgi:hypothetical protein